MAINYFDPNPNQEVEEDFKDQPPEMTGEEPVDIAAPVANGNVQLPGRPIRPKTATVQLPEAQEQEYEAEEGEQDAESEDQEDFSSILSDARLRLEQGRLYELIMNHDIFQGADADPKAVKFVQRQIRNFAKEQMEIMLGMRKETSTIERLEMDFPFNSLEVDALKALARAATKGASDHADAYVPAITRTTEEVDNVPAPRKTTINPIGGASRRPAPLPAKKVAKPLPTKPAAPVARKRIDPTIQQILEEEGVTLEEVNHVFNPNKKHLTPEEFASLTDDQIIERNRQISIRNKRVENPQSVPMPTPEQQEAVAMQRATQAAAHPQMQQIMGLLDEASRKKGK